MAVCLIFPMENIIICCLGFIHICNYIVTLPTYFVHPDLALEWTRLDRKKSVQTNTFEKKISTLKSAVAGT